MYLHGSCCKHQNWRACSSSLVLLARMAKRPCHMERNTPSLNTLQPVSNMATAGSSIHQHAHLPSGSRDLSNNGHLLVLLPAASEEGSRSFFKHPSRRGLNPLRLPFHSSANPYGSIFRRGVQASFRPHVEGSPKGCTQEPTHPQRTPFSDRRLHALPAYFAGP